MTDSHQQQSGFSAVELLITLFIATIFVLAGYQLYSYVLFGGTQASQQAIASNVGYKYMRKTADSLTSSTCAPSTPVNNVALTEPGINNATVTVTVSCPYTITALQGVYLVKSTVQYKTATSTESVSHAIYTN